MRNHLLPALAVTLAAATLGTATTAPGDAAPARPEATAHRAAATAWGKAVDGTVSSSAARTFTYRVDQKSVLAQFVVGNLTADADLVVRNAKGTVVARSEHGGKRFESAVVRLTKGSYRVAVSAAGSASASFRLVGRMFTKPAILSARLLHTPDNEAEYVVEYVNPTTKPIRFNATLEEYDAQGGYVDSRDVENDLVAPAGGTGIAVTSEYDTHWGDFDHVKLVHGRFTTARCSAQLRVPVSKVRYDLHTTYGIDYSVTGQVTNPHRATVNTGGLFAKRDRMGVPYYAYATNLATVEGHRTRSFDTDIYAIETDDVPAWTVTGFVYDACD